MAGISWIKVEVTLPTKPVVMHVKRACGCSVNEAIGLIVRVLTWADGLTADGVCEGYVLEDLDEHFDALGLAAGLLMAGWIYVNEDGWVAFDNWENHNGEGAKKRAMDARRSGKYRTRKNARSQDGVTDFCDERHANVTQKCDERHAKYTNFVTVERDEMRDLDKIREDKSANALNAGARACEDFSLLDNLREAWPKGAKATAKLKQTWREVLAEGVTPDELMACFERQRISNQWQQEYPRYVPTLQKWLDERGFKEELRILRSARKKAQESRAEQLGEEDYPELSQSDLNSVFD